MRPALYPSRPRLTLVPVPNPELVLTAGRELRDMTDNCHRSNGDRGLGRHRGPPNDDRSGVTTGPFGGSERLSTIHALDRWRGGCPWGSNGAASTHEGQSQSPSQAVCS
jgi:hypothetical protein